MILRIQPTSFGRQPCADLYVYNSDSKNQKMQQPKKYACALPKSVLSFLLTGTFYFRVISVAEGQSHDDKWNESIRNYITIKTKHNKIERILSSTLRNFTKFL